MQKYKAISIVLACTFTLLFAYHYIMPLVARNTNIIYVSKPPTSAHVEEEHEVYLPVKLDKVSPPVIHIRLTNEQKEKAISIAERDPKVSEVIKLLGRIRRKEVVVQNIVAEVEGNSLIVKEFFIQVRIAGENGSINVNVELIRGKVMEITANLFPMLKLDYEKQVGL